MNLSDALPAQVLSVICVPATHVRFRIQKRGRGPASSAFTAAENPVVVTPLPVNAGPLLYPASHLMHMVSGSASVEK